jgi:transcriptional regulator with XRE-family HTH domain
MTVNRLRIICIQRGVRMDAVAAHVGVSKHTLSHYSNGRRPFPEDLQRQIAAYLGVEPADILPITDEQAVAQDSPQGCMVA